MFFYARLTLYVEQIDQEYGILELAARKGFYKLGLSYLRKLAEFVKGAEDALSAPLVPTIAALTKAIIEKCPPQVVKDALSVRAITYEHQSEDIGTLLEFDHIMELFDPVDQVQLQQEVTAAKELKRVQDEYIGHYQAYKATLCPHISLFDG